jgi:hypothetical protein
VEDGWVKVVCLSTYGRDIVASVGVSEISWTDIACSNVGNVLHFNL